MTFWEPGNVDLQRALIDALLDEVLDLPKLKFRDARPDRRALRGRVADDDLLRGLARAGVAVLTQAHCAQCAAGIYRDANANSAKKPARSPEHDPEIKLMNLSELFADRKEETHG